LEQKYGLSEGGCVRLTWTYACVLMDARMRAHANARGPPPSKSPLLPVGGGGFTCLALEAFGTVAGVSQNEIETAATVAAGLKHAIVCVLPTIFALKPDSSNVACQVHSWV